MAGIREETGSNHSPEKSFMLRSQGGDAVRSWKQELSCECVEFGSGYSWGRAGSKARKGEGRYYPSTFLKNAFTPVMGYVTMRDGGD